MDFETVNVFDDLTQEEKDRMSLELARAVIETESLKETLAENSADIKSKIKTKQGIVTTISRTLSLGKIQREIAISRKKDMPAGVMRTIDLRTDTEIPNLRRPLRPDELQEELELDAPENEPITQTSTEDGNAENTGNADGKLQPGTTDSDQKARVTDEPAAAGKGKAKKTRRKNP